MMKFFKKKTDIPRRRLEGDSKTAASPIRQFKRSQTLVASVSDDAKSPRIQVHHLVNKRRRLTSILLVTILAILSLWFLIGNFTATVSVSSSDTTMAVPIETAKYQAIIQDYLRANPLSRFNFFLNQSDMTNFASDIAPEIENVVQKSMIGIGVTDFNVKMRSPVAGWEINGKQYYVDASGIPFETNYFSSPEVKIIDNSGASLQAGEASVSRRFLGFVGLVVSLARSSGYTVTQAVLPINTTRQLDITLRDVNLLVKMSIDRPAGEQVEDMSRAVKYFESHGKMPSYIDVRVSGKAFYI
jgi:hypothetical protein